MQYLITDQKGKKDASKTIFVVGAFICLIRVLLSGVQIGEFQFPQADLAGLAAFVGALGAIHFGRSHTKAKESV